jgi:hypothetical protein
VREFIGRTARIGNKGTYTIFEIDSRAKNTSSEVYFKNKLEELKNNAIIDLSGNSLPSDNQTELICQEEVKETFLLPQKRAPPDGPLNSKTIKADSAHKIRSIPLLLIHSGDPPYLKTRSARFGSKAANLSTCCCLFFTSAPLAHALQPSQR